MNAHGARVERLAAQVRQALGHGQVLGFAKEQVSHFVPDPHRVDRRPRLDMRDFAQILDLDPVARTCTAEPGVAFVDLARQTLRHGLLPTVVPELKGITVGGAVAGCSLESMSFRYGGFHDSCHAYEIVTGAGEVRRLTPEDDLFHMVHGSYGTLARLTAATFDLVPARPFVHMEYRRHRSFDAWWQDVRAHADPARADVDFVDGILHGPDHLVLCVGRMVHSAPWLSRYDGTAIYYKSTALRDEDYLETEQYLFRYDRECHWLSRTFPPLEWRPVRALLGRWFLGSTNLITWSKRLAPVYRQQRRPDVVVDVFLPARRFPEFYRWYEADFSFWPLWIVPYRVREVYPWISDERKARMADTLLIDAAVYGRRNHAPDVDWSEVLERKTYDLDGIKTLISRNHHDEQTFWEVYSKPRYDRAKRELDPHGLFGDLYQKFRPLPL